LFIFQHSLDFVDEPILPHFVSDNNAKTIKIFASHSLFFASASYCTVWMKLSSRDVRFCAYNPMDTLGADDDLILEVKDVVRLYWQASRREISYIKESDYTPERLFYWIVHTFLPIVLQINHTYHILHVASVVVDTKPLLFSASSYGGKSTLIDYFIHRGATLLSDDSLGIEQIGENYYAIPAYPYHRPFRDIETLGYFVDNFAKKPIVTKVLYSLVQEKPSGDITIKKLYGVEKFQALKKTIFVNFQFLKKRHFLFLTQLAQDIDVYSITVPWDASRLNEVYDAIVKHSKQVMSVEED